MTVSARKIAAFAKLVAGLADTPNLGSTALLKQWFDSSPEELRVAVNGLIDDLIATAAGASGTEQIGSAPISGVTGATAYAQLVDLKSQLNGVVLGQIPPDMLASGLAREILVNPNFDIWQMGTSFVSPPLNSYLADQWYCTSSTVSNTFSKQTASPPVGSSAYARFTPTALNGLLSFGQALASDTCNKLKGKAVSASFQMRRDATYDGNYELRIETNSVADTSAGTWTLLSSAFFTPTTSWALYKLENIVIPAGANGIRIVLNFSGGSRPANSYVEFAQIHMNMGSVALSFQPRIYTEEERLCQWFCHVVNPTNNVNMYLFGGIADSATSFRGIYRFPTTMRVVPTLIVINPASLRLLGPTVNIASAMADSGLTFDSPNSMFLNVTSTGLTINSFYHLQINSDGTARLIFDARL